MPDAPRWNIMGPIRSGDGSWLFEMFLIDPTGNIVTARAEVRARNRDAVMQIAQAIHGIGNELPPEILRAG
jgi:hypothetical protein